MLRVVAIAGLAGVLCAGCANDTLTPSSGLTVSPLNMLTTGSTGGTTRTIPLDGNDTVDLATDKTMAGRVLTAIALERVTGRKPDPATLSTIN
ncbi:MAG: hypothetical protein AAFV45_13620 [Pseudomonadota bacterium]